MIGDELFSTLGVMQTPSPQEIVHRLGGVTAVGAATGSHRFAIYQWYRSGIPWKHHSTLMAFAQEQGVLLTRMELERSRYSDGLKGNGRYARAARGEGSAASLAMAS